jgi:hypothetical protein
VNVDDAAKALTRMSEQATGTDKIALVVASEFIRRVLRSRSAILDVAQAVSPRENLNQKSLFDE